MGVTQTPIQVEKVLEAIFAYLPDRSYEDGGDKFPVIFGYGDDIALNVFLKNREITESYPLIWLLMPYEEKHFITKVTLEKVVFIIAVDTNEVMENKQRLDETFGKVLMPLFDDFKYVFKAANVINTSSEYEVIKYPNYGENDKTLTTAIWDALKVTVSFSVIDTCLKPIKF